jgi:hypothetical protein
MRSARFALLASAAALAACTTFSNPVGASIVAGTTTRAEVEKMAGAPVQQYPATSRRAAETLYLYSDPWGNKYELSVQYDENNVVKSTFWKIVED